MDLNIKSNAIIEVGGDTYFSSLDFNALFCKKRDSKFASFLGEFYSDRLHTHHVHTNVFSKDEKLFFIPWEGNAISVFDLNQGKFEHIQASEDVPYIFGFCGIVSLGDNYVLLPNILSQDFMLLSPDNKKIECIETISNHLQKLSIDRNRNWIDCFGSCVSEDGTVYLGLAETSNVILLSLEDLSLKQLDIKGAKIGNIFEKDGYLWICENTGSRLIRYEINSKNIKEYVLEDSPNVERPFYRFINVRGDIYLLPCQASTIWKYDRQKDKWDIFMDTDEIIGFERVRPFPATLFFDFKMDGNVLELFAKAGNGTLRINLDTKETEVIPVVMTSETADRIEESAAVTDFEIIDNTYKECGQVISEGTNNIYLKDMLRYIKD